MSANLYHPPQSPHLLPHSCVKADYTLEHTSAPTGTVDRQERHDEERKM